MKMNNFGHAVGAIGCIGGIYGLHNESYHIWQWPVIALLWCISSYVSAYSAHRANKK
jgi:uncharacterized membrane protein